MERRGSAPFGRGAGFMTELRGRGTATDPGPIPDRLPGVRGLFRRHVSGDDALLRLAALRFEQAGMPAELYADSPDDLDRVLAYVPDHPTPPTVHLNRGVDLLNPADQARVKGFAEAFAGRVSGLVVHDRPWMRDRVPELVDALRAVGDRTQGPHVFLEYAAGAPLDWFADVAARTADVERAGVCIDTGHVGLAEVHRHLVSPPAVGPLSARDGSLEEAADRVHAATAAALPAVLGLIRDVAGSGGAVHFHLHDGHPAVPDLSDHFSFLFRLPVPFEYRGVRSLDPMYGPTGLAEILGEAVRRIAPEQLSLTLEVHQAEGRLPLYGEARGLFRHWSDPTNAERFNYWLSVIADNHVLARSALVGITNPADPEDAADPADPEDAADPADPAGAGGAADASGLPTSATGSTVRV
jgi:hypothetical protein